MDLVTEASLHDSKWREYAKRLNCGSYSDDVVNEFYLKLSTITEIKQTNVHGFFVVVLRNMINDFHRTKSKLKFTELSEIIPEDSTEQNIDLIEFDRIVKKSINLANEISLFDGALFEHYLTSKNSYRKIAKGSGISFDTIKVSIKNTKRIIKKQLQSEWKELTR